MLEGDGMQLRVPRGYTTRLIGTLTVPGADGKYMQCMIINTAGASTPKSIVLVVILFQ